MEGKQSIARLIAENTELKNKLFECQNLLDAIKSGAIDALVVTNNGQPTIYSLETADYTYRLLIEKFGEGALSISESGMILYCNESFSKIVNVPADKLVGTFFVSYIDSIGKFTDLKSKLNSGVSKGEVELNINGRKIPVCLSLTDLQPNLPAIGIIVTELAEKKKHEEDIAKYQAELEDKVRELNQTNVKLEQFIHLISQNIKEPIRMILNYSSALIKDGFARNKSIARINTSALRLDSFVNELINNPVDANINKSEIDLNVIVNEVIDDMELIIKENSAGVHILSLPKINGYVIQLRQLFFSCIISFLKDGYKAPEIEIDYQMTNSVDSKFPNKNFYLVSVTCCGPRATQSKKKKLGVAGNGSRTNDIELAICKRIMENHSGFMKRAIDGRQKKIMLFFEA